ncbi:MAG: hypothetical protein ACSLEN_02350 [Candidatus Malihini olakiniferum]
MLILRQPVDYTLHIRAAVSRFYTGFYDSGHASQSRVRWVLCFLMINKTVVFTMPTSGTFREYSMAGSGML